MHGQGKEIRRRIKSIKSTHQITKAMELVSAAKMRKATERVLASRPYSTVAWDTVQAIAEKVDNLEHPLLTPRMEAKKIALVLITSNRGLAGSFNTNIIEKARKYIEHITTQTNQSISLILLGKKSKNAAIKFNFSVIAEFEKADIIEQVEEVRPITHLILNEYNKLTIDRVVLAYTDFISTLSQKPRIRQLLTIIGEDPYLGHVEASSRQTERQNTPDQSSANSRNQQRKLASTYGYKFEPSPSAVLDELLPRLVEVQLYQALLESNASEHSARMMAMRNATDAASDMISELTLLFNQARQASITQEIAEISAGRIAIEQ